MIARSIVIVALFGLAGCDTTDRHMGLATAQNIAAHQAAARDPSVPLEGGSAVLGASAVKRYQSGTVRQPGFSTVEPASVPGDTAPAPSPR
jgi:hypothetical protein